MGAGGGSRLFGRDIECVWERGVRASEREIERERESVCDMLETEAMITDSLCLCVWRIERDMYMGLCVV